MKLLSPTQHRRLNEIVGFLLLSLGLVMLLSLVSYHTQDPSFDTAAASRLESAAAPACAAASLVAVAGAPASWALAEIGAAMIRARAVVARRRS